MKINGVNMFEIITTVSEYILIYYSFISIIIFLILTNILKVQQIFL
jgi:hypothetical protein